VLLRFGVLLYLGVLLRFGGAFSTISFQFILESIFCSALLRAFSAFFSVLPVAVQFTLLKGKT
jgi:hypothetical protein